MRKHVVRATALWLAGAVIAAAGATAAVSFLGTGLFGASGQPLTQADVQQRLTQQAPAAAASGQSSPAPGGAARSPGPSAVTPAAGSVKVIPISGGTVFASCSSGLAKLTWSMAQGYQADGALAGPARSAWVKFKSGTTEQLVTVTCSGNHPQDVVSAPDVSGKGGGRGGHDG